MKWFYKRTNSDGLPKVYGPFDDQTASDATKAEHASHDETSSFSDSYEDEDDAYVNQARAVSRVARADGSEYLTMSDGATIDLIQE
jgi:hypothetical protein